VPKKKSRLFALAEHLRARRTGVTAEELAEHFNVTVRTIYRDLEALRDADIPIRGERGPGGGFALDKTYNLPPVNFNAREAALLVVLGRFATEMRLLPFNATLSSALDKLRAALSTADQRELAKHTTNLLFVGIPAAPVPEPIRKTIEEAWFENKPVRVRYRHSGGIVDEHRVRIERLLLERTMTILECDDVDEHVPRRFRLNRIDLAELL
jgi:predicted DNA-binding transcriptional regulator YafY